MNKLLKVIKILILGDIHLGHQNNKTGYIIESLKLFFKENIKEFKKLDYIVINGDLFEKALLSYSVEYIQSITWFQWLIKFCSDNDIKLILLEGTASHDNNQGAIIPNLIKEWDIKVNFRYVKDIEIIYDSEFDTHLLFVPDRNHKTAKERFNQIKRMMLDLKIDKVDFAFMHGFFKHQLPVVNDTAHDEEDYLSIVRYYTVINHVHIKSVYDRIIAPGSFERLNHSEEEDKGGVLLSVESEANMKFKFLINNNARIFKTITIKNDSKDLVKIFKEIDKVCKHLPYTAFVRILSKHKLDIAKEVKERYLLSGVKEEITKKDKANIRDLFNIKNSNIVELQITKDNILELMLKELENVNPEYISIIENKINKINSEL